MSVFTNTLVDVADAMEEELQRLYALMEDADADDEGEQMLELRIITSRLSMSIDDLREMT